MNNSINNIIAKIKKNYFIFILITLVIIVITLLILFIFLPKHREIKIILDDRCGPIMNMISHTIGDEYSCRNKCIAQCEVKGMKLHHINFTLNLAGCNDCECYCR